MTRCIGCGAEVSGASCAHCQTPSRGARFVEHVDLHRGSRLPNLCCCCLEPATTSLELRRQGMGIVAIAQLPSCRGCKLRGISTRVMKWLVWIALVIGFEIVGSKLAPAYPEYVGIVAILGTVPFALLLARALVPTRLGHTPGCLPAALGSDVGGSRRYEFRNRAFAQIVRATDPPATPMDRVVHAMHEMREGLGFPPSR